MWGQAIGLALLWVAIGVWIRPRGHAWGQALRRRPRPQVVLLATLGFVLSLVVLVAGLAGIVQSGGVVNGRLTDLALVLTAVVGTVFVAGQTLSGLALAVLVLPSTPTAARGATETKPTPATSDSKETPTP
ncbi:MAG TPA: hypothetical protein PLB31_01635 [Fimbriimonadaceae bacterium]|nr:hypothetical protein [Armatimonadota bacterium]HCM72699.1 hypothetical protein [Armatimonadota bacterium]HRE94774.1 hypothetical protein [Fimbriimonadaceae bacterium]HRI73155.1 hypothetical protein [Fimbriimonadaceae bacterium]